LNTPPTRTRAPEADSAVIDLAAATGRGRAPLVCLSHLRWEFVFQRPQHLMTRFAKSRPVFFFEEPVRAEPDHGPSLTIKTCEKSGVVVATPCLPDGLEGWGKDVVLRQLLDELLATYSVERPIVWYYTPMMLPIARHLEAGAVVYDCMDELSAFRFAPQELKDLEAELMALADVVFTGGFSIYEAKKDRHRNIHPFPSSVDRKHFAAARTGVDEPADMQGVARPRLGFYGVIDERIDLELLAAVADARPDWQIVMVGPVVKMSEDELPRRPNLHYPGGKSYAELPSYLGSWDAALMPFAINESTRFISPTKTPEYLAGGRPVVSTPITDVIRHYGDLEAVQIAANSDEFVAACERALQMAADPSGRWLKDADAVLAELSWDQTYIRMEALIERVLEPGKALPAANAPQSGVVAPTIRPSNRKKPYDALVVGCGFAGSVIAERMASQQGKRVLMVDRRPHIAGNAYDHLDAAGVLIHRYGPHIFHTNSADIFQYLSKFTEWRPYEHRVLAQVRGKLVPMPINRTTINLLYDLDLQTDEQAEAWMNSRAEPVEVIRTSEDVVVSKVGRELYELFFQGYTRKQWGIDPSGLDKSVTSRVPTRTDTDDRYFMDQFQAMPLHGYTRMFENMLDHDRIEIELGVDYEDVRREAVYDQLVFTGPIDEYFDHRYGELPYRSLKFRHETVDQEWFQPVGVVNYPSPDVPYTRITEYKHLTGQQHRKTSVTYEYPSAEGDPYYPIPRAENQALFKKYEALALANPEVTFVGRLATYRYYNMDQVVGQALAAHRRMVEREGRKVAAAGDTQTKAAAAI
jgi:UDP-galactopyranose mutase